MGPNDPKILGYSGADTPPYSKIKIVIELATGSYREVNQYKSDGLFFDQIRIPKKVAQSLKY